MNKTAIFIILVFCISFSMDKVFAYYERPMYGYGYGYRYYSSRAIYPEYRTYVREYEYGKHPLRDKRRLKYIKEYYSAVNSSSNSYQKDNKVVNVNISM